MSVPIIYYMGMAYWLCQATREACQYLLGLILFLVFSPFVNLWVFLHSCLHMDQWECGRTPNPIPEDIIYFRKPSVAGQCNISEEERGMFTRAIHITITNRTNDPENHVHPGLAPLTSLLAEPKDFIPLLLCPK